MGFEQEYIPDEDFLYYRVHHVDIVNSKVVAHAFRARGAGTDRGMSTDWSKYSTPQQAKEKAKSPANNSIVRFSVKKVRQVPVLSVEHAPLPDNRAHSHILGIPEKGEVDPTITEMRERLQKMFDHVLD